MRVASFALWLAAACLSAWVVLARDALVALPGETLPVALAFGAAHLALGSALTLARPRWRWVAPIPPLALAAAWIALRPAAPPRLTAGGTGPNVALITLDTFRADHLGALGSPVPTPRLDALAAEGLLFDNAVATAPLTAPSHASMLTGLPTRAHGLVGNGGALRVAPRVAPRLATAGYRTGAFLSSRVLDRGTGLDAGFDHYDDRWGWRQRLDWLPGLTRILGRGRPAARPGDETVARALRWVGQAPGPFFLWVHLFDAHSPYLAPPGWRPSPEEIAAAAAEDRASRLPSTDRASFTRNLERGYAHGQRLLYRSAVRWTDHLVGRLVDGLPPDTAILVVGDHGESLGEHDYWFNHGASLAEPSMRVPQILRAPGRIAGGQRSHALVGGDQVAGLLLALAGLDDAALGAQGPTSAVVRQFTPGQQARGRFGRSAGPEGPALALRLADAKLVLRGTGDPVYYDLVADPGELAPLPVPAALAAEAAALKEQAAGGLPGPDAAQTAWLEAIGYTTW